MSWRLALVLRLPGLKPSGTVDSTVTLIQDPRSIFDIQLLHMNLNL
jgi:hypothetical protein